MTRVGARAKTCQKMAWKRPTKPQNQNFFTKISRANQILTMDSESGRNSDLN